MKTKSIKVLTLSQLNIPKMKTEAIMKLPDPKHNMNSARILKLLALLNGLDITDVRQFKHVSLLYKLTLN